MKPRSKIKRTAGIGAFLAAAMAASGIVAPPASAEPVSLTLDYACSYPLIGMKDIKVEVKSDIPAEVNVGEQLPRFQISANTTIFGDTTEGLYTMRAATIEGRATAEARVWAPGYPDGVGANTRVAIPSTTVPESGDFTVEAQGSTPSLNFEQAGWAQINVGNLSLSVTPKDADGNPTALGTLSVECYQKPGQDNVLQQTYISDGGTKPPKPAPENKPTEQGTPPKDGNLPTQNNQVELTYKCPLPLIGTHPLKVKATLPYPAEIPTNTYAPRMKIDSISTIEPATVEALQTIEAATLEGSALAFANMAAPEITNGPLAAQVKMPIDKIAVPQDWPDVPAMDIPAKGEAPELVFAQTGQGSMGVGDIQLTMTPRKADGTPTDMGTFTRTCVQDPDQQNKIAEFTIKEDGGGGGDTEPPTVPADVKATVDGSTATLTWTASTDNEGGTGVGGYKVYRDGAEIASVTEPTYTDADLAPGTYNYTVSAFDKAKPTPNPSAKSDPPTEVTIAEPGDKVAPSTPQNVTVGDVTDTTVALTWDPSTDNEGGTGVGGYDVKYGDKVVTVTEPKATIPGLSPTTEYTFTVTAFDKATPERNDSQPSDPVTATTKDPVPDPDETAPSVPKNLVVSNVTETSADIAWDAAQDNEGGTGVGGYIVFVNGNEVATVTEPKYTLAGLAPATSYSVTVLAFDNASPAPNKSAESAPLAFDTKPKVDVTPPDAPQGLEGSDVTYNSVKLTWQPAKDNEGGSGLAGYEIYQDGTLVKEVDAGTTMATIGNLQPETKYTFTVRAKDKAGNPSADSNVVEVTTKEEPTGSGYSYNLKGSTSIKGANGKAPLSGSVKGTIAPDNSTSGDLTLNPTTAQLTVFGFLPVTADLTFAPQGKTTGQIGDGTATANTKVLVKVPSVKMFGFDIGGGDTCQTASPLDMKLKSDDFTRANGGTFKGSYTLPELKDCGFLTPVLSGIVSGPGNTVNITASPSAG